MAIRRNRDSGRMATSILASIYVLMAGMGLAILIICGFARQPMWPATLTAVGVMVVIAGICFFAARLPQDDRGFFWFAQRPERDPLADYNPKRVSRREKYGSQPPPTLESVKNLKDNTSTWVPSPKRRISVERDG